MWRSFLPTARVMHNAARLSLLSYEAKENLQDWACGKKVHLWNHGGLLFGGEFPESDFTNRHVVAYGRSTDIHRQGHYHKVQWVYTQDGNTLYVAFKGSDNTTDFFLDASVSDVVTPSGCRMHSGFYSGIQSEISSVLEKIKECSCTEVVFCGHSLGGAYATAVTLELTAHPCWPQNLKAQAVTFGAPLIIGNATLPSRVATQAPNMTHVVANFDLIPRILCLERDALVALLEMVPSLLSYTMQTIANVALSAGYAKIDSLVDSVQHFRDTFTAAGTFVFGQTALLVDKNKQYTRRTSVTVVPPDNVLVGGALNTAAHQYLRFFPTLNKSCRSFQDAELSKELFVQNSISDHSLGQVYWPLIEHLTRSPEHWNDTLSKHEKIWQFPSDARQPLRAAFENYDATTSLNLPVPSVEMMKEMPHDIQEQWQSIWLQLESLAHRTDQAVGAALQKMPESQPRAVRVVKDPVPAAVGEAAFKMKHSFQGPHAPIPWLVNATGEQLGVAKLDSGTSVQLLPAECYDLLNWCKSGEVLILSVGSDTIELAVPPGNSTKEAQGISVLTVEKSGIAGILVWRSSILPENLFEAGEQEDASGADDSSVWSFQKFDVRQNISQFAEQVARRPQQEIPEWRLNVKPSNLVRIDEAVVATAYPEADSKLFHLHNLTQTLMQDSSIGLTWIAHDKSPRGVGLLPSQFTKSAVCTGCTQAITSYPSWISTAGYNCSSCGKSFCDNCSPLYHKFLNISERQRVCVECAGKLAVSSMPSD
ncbi:hypothetical protein DIPPA_70164 [Diplonema papillatum]|nr:hypothetical protein DIPPA_70164 [Diplonema papillatum]